MDTRLTPEEIEKLAEDTAIHWGKVMIPLQEQRESQQALISFKAGMKAQLAKLAAVPDEKMAKTATQNIFQFALWYVKWVNNTPITNTICESVLRKKLDTQSRQLLSQLALYQNAKEIQAREGGQ